MRNFQWCCGCYKGSDARRRTWFLPEEAEIKLVRRQCMATGIAEVVSFALMSVVRCTALGLLIDTGLTIDEASLDDVVGSTPFVDDVAGEGGPAVQHLVDSERGYR